MSQASQGCKREAVQLALEFQNPVPQLHVLRHEQLSHCQKDGLAALQFLQANVKLRHVEVKIVRHLRSRMN